MHFLQKQAEGNKRRFHFFVSLAKYGKTIYSMFTSPSHNVLVCTVSLFVLPLHLRLCSILSSFHLDFLAPLPPAADLSLSLFPPTPSRAWLRCEIILLLGGFSCYMSLSSVGTEARGGVPFPNNTLRFTTLSVVNSWARDWRAVHPRSGGFTGLGRVTHGPVREGK